MEDGVGHGADVGAGEYTTALICSAERRWYETDTTYYKVAPAELPGLIDCDIDVPADILRLPYESIVITLPEGHGCPRLMDTASGELRTIMASHSVLAGGEGMRSCPVPKLSAPYSGSALENSQPIFRAHE